MPKAPILFRETFFSTVRGGPRDTFGTEQIKHLEWNRVETELGTMVEPRTPSVGGDATGKIVQIDMTDVAYSKISLIDEGVFYSQFNTGGSGTFDYNA